MRQTRKTHAPTCNRLLTEMQRAIVTIHFMLYNKLVVGAGTPLLLLGAWLRPALEASQWATTVFGYARHMAGQAVGKMGRHDVGDMILSIDEHMYRAWRFAVFGHADRVPQLLRGHLVLGMPAPAYLT